MKRIFLLTEAQLKKMVDQRAEDLTRRDKEKMERESEAREAALAMLQSQINPHFLYNALESIRGQAILDGSEVIENVAEALGNYFRYNISARSSLTTLSAELENVRTYVRIQQFRFQNRFHFELECTEENSQAKETILPRMTLQPIVENAIAHGFERSRKEWIIRLTVEFTGKSVRVVVSDNGIGMDEEKLRALNDRIAGRTEVQSESNDRHNGIALPNVNKRIRLMFGNAYGLHVESIPDIGTDVQLLLPFCTNVEENHEN